MSPPRPASSWDYIVIGAGSAGCALAAELAQRDPTQRILILEAGGSDRSPFIKLPACQGRAMTRHDWGYRSQPDLTRNGAVESWLRGRVLGGSSSINGTMYVRGAAADFDRWALELAAGEGLSWAARDVMPWFRRLESSDQHHPLRGCDGPMHVRTVKRPHALTRAFIESARAWGCVLNEDYNAECQQGVGYAQLSQRKGLRCSSADAFLRPQLGRKNLQLRLKANVSRIEVVGRRAVAVIVVENGVERREAARDVIVCAGAIGSPKLLMLSGIGDPEELRRHGIEVAVPLPGVGRNLQEHPLLGFTYRTRIPSYNLTGGLSQRLRILSMFLASREGPIANLFEGVAFLKSAASEPVPDIQLHFLPVGYVTKRGGSFELTSYPAATVLLNKSYPVSRGRIRLSSGHADEAPLIECRLLEDVDVETMARGVQVVRDIMRAEPIAPLVDEEVIPGVNINSPRATRDYIRTHTGIAYHPVGTCRMGHGSDAVVSPDLRVHGTDNLWVADASVMPGLISGNTNAVCMMIGARLGGELQQRRVA